MKSVVATFNKKKAIVIVKLLTSRRIVSISNRHAVAEPRHSLPESVTRAGGGGTGELPAWLHCCGLHTTTGFLLNTGEHRGDTWLIQGNTEEILGSQGITREMHGSQGVYLAHRGDTWLTGDHKK